MQKNQALIGVEPIKGAIEQRHSMQKNKTTWEERFDKDEGIQAILKLIKKIGIMTGVGKDEEFGKYIKNFISQERKQWKADLREKIKNMEVTNFDISGDRLLERRISGYNNALSDMLSLLASPDGPGAGKEEYE